MYDDDDDEADEGCHCSKRLLPSGLAISVVVRLFATLAARSHVSRAFMQHVFFIISLILPTALQKDWPDWSQVVYRIEARKNDSEEIHTCVHDHVLFCDDHAELDACPKCGSARYYTDGSVRRPRKVVIMRHPEHWLRRLFANAQVAKLLRARDAIADPVTHPTETNGWHRRMRQDTFMSRDPRNVGVDMFADGVPLTDKRKDSFFPIVLRATQLADDPLGSSIDSTSMVALLSCTYHNLDGTVVSRSPKSLVAVQAKIVSWMLALRTEGCTVYDAHEEQDFT